MKKEITKYLLFIYVNFIIEDWEDYKPWSIKFIKPLWFVKSFFVWLLSIIFIFILYPYMYLVEILQDIETYSDMN